MKNKKEKTKIRFSFKSKNQLPLFMVTKEYYNTNNEIYFAKILFEIKGSKMRKMMKKLKGKVKEMKKYRVINDLQGGDFGMGRDLTIEEWREQAIDWADLDEHDGIIKELKKLKEKDVLDYIAEFWQIKFEEVKGEN